MPNRAMPSAAMRSPRPRGPRTATQATRRPAMVTAARTKCRKRGRNVGSASAAQARSATAAQRSGCMWSRFTDTWIAAMTRKHSASTAQHRGHRLAVAHTELGDVVQVVADHQQDEHAEPRPGDEDRRRVEEPAEQHLHEQQRGDAEGDGEGDRPGVDVDEQHRGSRGPGLAASRPGRRAATRRARR